MLKNIKETQGFVGQKKFLVAARWWNNWCDYTGFELRNEERNSGPAKQVPPPDEGVP